MVKLHHKLDDCYKVAYFVPTIRYMACFLLCLFSVSCGVLVADISAQVPSFVILGERIESGNIFCNYEIFYAALENDRSMIDKDKISVIQSNIILDTKSCVSRSKYFEDCVLRCNFKFWSNSSGNPPVFGGVGL